MNIGIITIHFPYNYGAMLQAFALKQYLNAAGNKASIIDYRPYHIDKNYHFYLKSLFLHPKVFVRSILSLGEINRSDFNSFLKNKVLAETVKFDKVNENTFDVLITGSDQVWNPNITGGDLNYLLNFAKTYGSKKISYASSIAVNNVDESWKNVLAEQLKKYDFISLREQKEIDFIQNTIGKKVHQVLDPTFLLSTNDWQTVERKPTKKQIPSNYILVYKLQKSNELDKVILEYKAKTGLKVISIHPFNDFDSVADFCLNEIGPTNFLWLIDHADSVFTNSFHGTAFSVIYRKKFLSIPHTETGSRMTSLINMLKLEKNNEGLYFLDDKNIELLEEKICSSKKLLNQAIEIK